MLLPALVGAALAAVPGPAPRPDSTLSVPVTPASRVWFHGSSNLRHFTCRAREVGGAFTLLDGVGAGAIATGAHPAIVATLRVPVASLDCGIGQQNAHLRETLRAGEHPAIELRATGYTAYAAGDSASVRVEGTIAVAGREHAVSLPGTVRRAPDGRLHLTGRVPLDVRDFGIVPPRRFLGLLRVRSRVLAYVDVVLPE